MKKTTKYTLATCASVTLLIMPMLVLGATTSGPAFDPTRGRTGTGMSEATAYTMLTSFMKQALIFLTILGVLGFIISGIVYITAGGAGKADTAQKWLQYSIVGIIVGLIGYIVIVLLDTVIGGSTQTT